MRGGGEVGSVARPEGMGGPGGGWQREAPALLSTALLLGGALPGPERPPAPLFTIDSILAPRPAPPGPPLQLHLHSPFHRAPELFGTSAKMFMMGEAPCLLLHVSCDFGKLRVVKSRPF